MKKLLFITPELPYPAQSGGKVKSLQLLQALSAKYQVTLACPLKEDDSQHVQEFHAVSPCVAHLHDEIRIPRNASNLALSYARRIPLNVLRTTSKILLKRIAGCADDFDIVVLDHYEVMPYLPADFEGLTVYHAHNAYFKIWERFAQLPGNPAMRAAAALEARRVRRYESSVASSVDLTFAAPNDAAELVKAGVDSSRIKHTFHLGDDSQLDLPELKFEGTRKKLMYVGFLGWEANVQGLLWFIEHVWPQVVRTHPDVRFDIVGKNPDKRLQAAVAPYHGISLKGYVADLQTIYRDSRVSVAPLLFGSGMKVKVLDAMARGMPTVTTEVGAEGIDAVSGEHLLVANSPGGMADNIDRLLTDSVLWQSLQHNSRELIRERYTWRQLFTHMHREIETAMKHKRSDAYQASRTVLQHVG